MMDDTYVGYLTHGARGVCASPQRNTHCDRAPPLTQWTLLQCLSLAVLLQRDHQPLEVAHGLRLFQGMALSGLQLAAEVLGGGRALGRRKMGERPGECGSPRR